MNRLTTAIAALLVVSPVLVGAPATGTVEGAGDAALYPPGAEVRGHSRAHWLSELGAWELEIPAPESPLLHPDAAANCTTDVFEVAYVNLPTSLGRSRRPCVVPTAMPVHLAVLSWECSTAEARAGLQPRRFPGRSFRNLRRCANTMFARDFGPRAATIRLWVDGRRVTGVHRYAVTTRPRTANLPEDSVFDAFAPTGTDVAAGPTRTVRRSLLLLFRPFAPGLHRVRIVARAPVLGAPLRESWLIRVPG